MAKISNKIRVKAEIRGKGESPRRGAGSPPRPIVTREIDAAMSFGEIAEKLGITHQGASHLYYNALRKLRRCPGALKLLADMRRGRSR